MQAGADIPSPVGPEADGRASWMRLLLALALATIGGVGMWCVVVALPAIQAEFGADRGTASLPYTFLTLGFALRRRPHGRWSDRFGVMPVVIGGAVLLGFGFIAAAAVAESHGLRARARAPDRASAARRPSGRCWPTSRTGSGRRGIAVALAASGNYLAGAIWPPVCRPSIERYGWRRRSAVIGVICLVP